MSVRTRSRALLLGGLVAGVSTLLHAPAASADTQGGLQDCTQPPPAPLLCVFSGDTATGERLETSQSNNNWGWIGNPYAFRTMKNDDESAYNTPGGSPAYAFVYYGTDYTGSYYCMDFGQYRRTLSSPNNAESHKFTSGC